MLLREDQEDEDPRNLQILKTEGERVVEGPKLESVEYAKPLRTCKVNIGTKDNPKFTTLEIIGMKKLLRRLLIYCVNTRIFFRLHSHR
jgi:hypothetical protein